MKPYKDRIDETVFGMESNLEKYLSIKQRSQIMLDKNGYKHRFSDHWRREVIHYDSKIQAIKFALKNIKNKVSS